MNDQIFSNEPEAFQRLLDKCQEIGFTMPSDRQIGALLKTLIASKPGGSFLELGTGIGLSLSWMIDGMDTESHLISVDNDPKLIDIVTAYFGGNKQVDLVCEEGSQWLKNNPQLRFDLIFADAWTGKYSDLDETLNRLNPGGFYVIDDMKPQPNWPEGHDLKAIQLVKDLESYSDLVLTKMNWSTGVIIASKI